MSNYLPDMVFAPERVQNPYKTFHFLKMVKLAAKYDFTFQLCEKFTKFMANLKTPFLPKRVRFTPNKIIEK